MEPNLPKFTLKDWSVEVQPREKLIAKGSQHLTNAELLAILIGSGNPGETAVQLMQRLIVSINYDLSELHRISLDELLKWMGIGPAKALKIKASLELGKRIQELPFQEKVSCNSSKKAYDNLFSVLSYLEQEEFWVLYLNIQNHVLLKNCLSKGGISDTMVDVRLLFKNAVRLG
jgi:DNA repair protein RadC